MLSIGCVAYSADKWLLGTFSANLENLSGALPDPRDHGLVDNTAGSLAGRRAPYRTAATGNQPLPCLAQVAWYAGDSNYGIADLSPQCDAKSKDSCRWCLIVSR